MLLLDRHQAKTALTVTFCGSLVTCEANDKLRYVRVKRNEMKARWSKQHQWRMNWSCSAPAFRSESRPSMASSVLICPHPLSIFIRLYHSNPFSNPLKPYPYSIQCSNSHSPGLTSPSRWWSCLSTTTVATTQSNRSREQSQRRHLAQDLPDSWNQTKKKDDPIEWFKTCVSLDSTGILVYLPFLQMAKMRTLIVHM